MAISSKLLNDGEKMLINTRTHPKVLLVPLLALVLLLAVGAFLQTRIDNDIATWIVWGVVAVGIVYFTVRPFLTWLAAGYAFTDRRMITREGILTRRGHDMPLSRISDVAYELDLIDRMLGCGTLVISDASEHGQVKLYDIPRVEETQKRLNQLLHDLHTGGIRDEGV